MEKVETYKAGEGDINLQKHVNFICEQTLGKKFGILTAEEYKYTTIQIRNNGSRRYRDYFNFKCDCGNNHITHIDSLKSMIANHIVPSCGCLNEERLKRNRDEYLEKLINENIGKRFGMLTILEYQGSETHKTEGNNVIWQYYFKCQCDCGNIVDHVSYSNLNSGHTRSCGCSIQKYNKSVNNCEDLIGLKFGMLTVDRLTESFFDESTNNYMYYYEASCDCGNKTIISRDILLSGSRLSCGCNKDYHLYINTRIYMIYRGILERCLNPNSTSFQVYGANGITICDRWANSFENFFNDMYDSYIETAEIYGAYNTSIDRIDVYGDYDSSNCRWANQRTQNLNKTDTRYITAFGQTVTLKDASIQYNISYECLAHRLNVGIKPELALMAPSGQLKEFSKKVWKPIKFV